MFKKLTKKFDSFEQEEKWLHDLALQGWRLENYEDVNIGNCTYKFIEDKNAKNLHYQIDYRLFSKKSEYQDYESLFEETGWTILSKNYSYNKHIFISDTKEKIFSDDHSQFERYQTRFTMARTYCVLFIIQALITGSLYFYFDTNYPYLGAITFFGIGATIYNGIDSLKRYKKLNKLVHT